MDGCIFCKIASHQIEKEEIFFEDEKVFAMLDDDWTVKGHSLVVWKEHVANMSDLSEDDFLHFSSVCRNVEARLLKILHLNKSIVLKSGLLEPHFHFHIYPVKSDIQWDTVRDMLEKKIQYTPINAEKEELLIGLRNL